MDVLMTFAEAAGAAGFTMRSFSGGAAEGAGFSSVSIDSRKVSSGGLFVALQGTATDGHRYVEQALKAGASGVLVSRYALDDPSFRLETLAKNAGAVLLVADDSLRGLQDLARCYLEKFPALITVGVTGSSGKTTTKEIAAAIIREEKSVVMNPGNLNSETGLPLSIFNIRPNHEIGIFEMGMNRRGEIAELAGILKPRIALITNIGSAHIGILGSKRAIAEEKKNIFSQFSGGETALIPLNEEYREFLAEGIRGRAVNYGAELFPEWGGAKDLGLDGSEIIWEGKAVRFALPGKHNLENAAAAIAIAREIGISAGAMVRGLSSVKALFGRSEVIPGDVTVIQDCYNANPESTAQALDFCDGLDWKGRRVYVIGSMLELGAVSAEAHGGIGRRLASSEADMVYLYGEETKPAVEALEQSPETDEIPFFYTDNILELSRALSGFVKPGDLVLLKGSRGCALEELGGLLTAGGGL
ncbi:UDP-N-acetylmuramoyl-tripeptide--D-alanyl-D-alanine ligase [Spirochaetia bacterium]|nr:UDP-N-acetylmuramoyl-tripeptide--D-alanyl-D-alanine ligase [Spirochaetia bacterium]